MTSTYVAWNGQAYAWPPPDGWYEAHDGRWWPNGVGPDDSGQPQHASTEADQSTIVPHRAEPAPATANTSPAVGAPGEGPTDRRDPDDQRPTTPQHQQSVDQPPQVDQPAQPLPGADAIPGEPDPAQRSWPLIAFAAAGVACIAILALVFANLGDDDDDGTQAGTDTTAADDSGVTNPTSDDNSTVLTVDGTESTTTPTAPPTTVTSATAVDTTADIEVTEAEEADRAAQVQRFRDLLTEEGFSGDLLADADIVEFATSFCLFVVAAESYDEYVSLRDEAIAGSASELGAGELAIAVDRAVEVFCADDAGRLGIGQEAEQPEAETDSESDG